MIRKIIYAEDEKDVLEVVEKRLTKAGFEVFGAENGQQAYELTLKHNPELIVTDVMMPIMNGFEFCKAIKHNNQTKQIPIIVLTAKVSMEDSFIFLGVSDFLRKPFQYEQLEARIQHRLSLVHEMHTQQTKILFHCAKPPAMSLARKLIEAVPQWNSSFVSTGMEVLGTAKNFIPEVIVLDLFMNDMPVDDLISQLKALPELARTEILTYYSPIEDHDSVAVQAKMIEIQYLKRVTAEAGAKEYLGPFNPANFMGLFKDYRKDVAV